jgi:hypothetical protein
MQITSYLSDFQGRTGASSIAIPADKLVRLPDQPCKFALLSNWSTEDTPLLPEKSDAGVPESDLDNLQELYYGFNGRLVAQLLDGRSTELLPVANLSQICVRTRPGQSGTLYFAWFW